MFVPNAYRASYAKDKGLSVLHNKELNSKMSYDYAKVCSSFALTLVWKILAFPIRKLSRTNVCNLYTILVFRCPDLVYLNNIICF